MELLAFAEATREEVEAVIKKLVDCISRGDDHFILLEQRQKNKDTLLRLGFTARDVRTVAEDLSYEDYYRGPNTNNSGNVPVKMKNSEMWEFGKLITGNEVLEVYIKFSFVEDDNGPFTCCVSFHEPEQTISYPLKSF